MSEYMKHAFGNAEIFGKEFKRYFVSLYRVDQCYGGPEEGGWYYDWYDYVSSRGPYASIEEAQHVFDTISHHAEQLSFEAKSDWNNRMSESCEWAYDRGIDPADLPEPDGPTSYFLEIETVPGEHQTTERPFYC